MIKEIIGLIVLKGSLQEIRSKKTNNNDENLKNFYMDERQLLSEKISI